MDHPLFIHKYQPHYFNEFVLEEDLLYLLNTLINIENINILFVGGSGCGKTSLLNAIVRTYYSLSKNANLLSNENILFINSLKEQGIHYYRTDVKTFCQTPCSNRGKKKMILLDDLDSMNEQSQQVFRNCIDKYSHNVHFVSSCISIHKIIESIQSRMYILNLPPHQTQTLRTIMDNILIKEDLNLSPEAKEFLLLISNNSVRILIHYLEKIKLLNKPIDLETAQACCTNIHFKTFSEYTRFIKEGDIVRALPLLQEIYDQGYSVMDILDNYFTFLKVSDEYTEEEKYRIIPYLCKYISVFYNIHEDEIELAFFTNNMVLLLNPSIRIM